MELTAAQQKRCDEIVEQALALDAGHRGAFVQDASSGDDDVRREADAILNTDPRGTLVFDVSPGAFLAPPKFGRYQTEERIGAGGMSIVYRAFDPVINRKVAIKVMAQRLDAPVGEYQRFLSELHLLGSLGHPSIVQVFDAGEHEGLPFIVMEYLEGENLAEAIQHGRCGTIELKLHIARQIAGALQRVHAAAVCHRDVKPANVFLEAGGKVTLMDFGVSARLDGPRVTQTGALIGTLPYLAPEQIRGEKIGPAVDIYAFGILLFELFTGTKPFSGAAAEILYKIAHTPVPAQPLAEIPPRLADLIRSSTAKAPTDRPHDFAEILRVLNGISSDSGGKRASRNKHLWAVAAAAMISIAAGWGWLSYHRPPVNRKEPTVTVASSIPAGAPTVHQLPSPELTSPEMGHKTSPLAKGAAGIATPNPSHPKLDLEKLASKELRQAPASPPAETVPDAPAPSTALIGGTVAPQNPPPLPATIPIVTVPVAPIAVAAPDVSKPDHKNAELNDSAGRKAAPDEKAAALSLPSAKPQNAADNREIRDVIERYAAAYRMKRIDEIKAVLDLSAAEQRTLSAIFRSNRIEAYRLSPQSDPRVEGDRALVFCERSISQIPTDRTALQRSPQTTNAKTDTVTVRLARTGGTWKIAEILTK